MSIILSNLTGAVMPAFDSGGHWGPEQEGAGLPGSSVFGGSDLREPGGFPTHGGISRTLSSQAEAAPRDSGGLQGRLAPHSSLCYSE